MIIISDMVIIDIIIIIIDSSSICIKWCYHVVYYT